MTGRRFDPHRPKSTPCTLDSLLAGPVADAVGRTNLGVRAAISPGQGTGTALTKREQTRKALHIFLRASGSHQFVLLIRKAGRLGHFPGISFTSVFFCIFCKPERRILFCLTTNESGDLTFQRRFILRWQARLDESNLIMLQYP